jgi:hypothetical protein
MADIPASYYQMLVNFIYHVIESLANIAVVIFVSHVFFGWPKAYKPKQNVVEEADKTWDQVGTFLEKGVEFAARTGLIKKEDPEQPKLLEGKGEKKKSAKE